MHSGGPLSTEAPLVIIAICKALPGKADALRAAQENLVAETVKENGCIRYELNQSIEDPHVLIFTESWTTEQRWKDHMHGAAMKRFQATGANQWFAEFAIHRMRVLAGGKGVADPNS